MAGKSISSKKSKKPEPVQAQPIDHVLVPKVEVATEDELKKLVQESTITRDKLPLIDSSDPAIAFLNLSPGGVVKFTRKSLVTGELTAYYRLVVSL